MSNEQERARTTEPADHERGGAEPPDDSAEDEAARSLRPPEPLGPGEDEWGKNVPERGQGEEIA